jgi:hypothetical protein
MYISFAVAPESKLPFPKDVIRRAIVEEFLEETDPDRSELLASGYIELEGFLPDEAFELVQAVFTEFFSTQPLLESSDPDEQKRAHEIFKRLPLQRFNEIQQDMLKRMNERLKDIQALRRIVGLPEE